MVVPNANLILTLTLTPILTLTLFDLIIRISLWDLVLDFFPTWDLIIGVPSPHVGPLWLALKLLVCYPYY